DDVVLLGAGEILERRAERFGRDDAEVDLKALGGSDRHFRWPAGENLPVADDLTERVHRFGWIGRHDENIEVADRLFAAAVAAGEFKLLNSLALFKMPAKLRDHAIGFCPEQPYAGRFGKTDAFEDGL